jgi:hypothetical protein
MDYTGYISAVYENNVREVDIPKNDLDFFVQELFKFELFHGPFSVYKIHSRLKQEGDSIAYKNVHQKMHKILSLGLIEEVSERREFDNLHAAKYYQISLNGWVNLILKGAMKYSPACKRAIRTYYYKNIIFKTFLYPFFRIETLLTFNDLEIGAFLMDCCIETIYNVETWEPDNKRVFGIPREKLLGLSKQKLHEVLEDKLYKSTKSKLDFLLSPGIHRDTLLKIIKDEAARKTEERGIYTNVEFVYDYSLPKEKWSEVEIIEHPYFQTVNVVEAISDSLDSQVNKFLIDQIIKGSHIPKRSKTLAYDDLFMDAIRNIEQEFRRSYDNLRNIKKQNKDEIVFNVFHTIPFPYVYRINVYSKLEYLRPNLFLFGF